jgi:hypothetical protein
MTSWATVLCIICWQKTNINEGTRAWQVQASKLICLSIKLCSAIASSILDRLQHFLHVDGDKDVVYCVWDQGMSWWRLAYVSIVVAWYEICHHINTHIALSLLIQCFFINFFIIWLWSLKCVGFIQPLSQVIAINVCHFINIDPLRSNLKVKCTYDVSCIVCAMEVRQNKVEEGRSIT